MSKKDFIALADAIREWNDSESGTDGARPFTTAHLGVLARFCAKQSLAFKRDRWLDYIAGKCGKNGGAVKG